MVCTEYLFQLQCHHVHTVFAGFKNSSKESLQVSIRIADCSKSLTPSSSKSNFSYPELRCELVMGREGEDDGGMVQEKGRRVK